MTSSASKAAWKNEKVSSQRSQRGSLSRLISKPAKRRLDKSTVSTVSPWVTSVETHLKSMTRLPTRFATPAFLITIERSKTTLEAVKLNRTRTRMNRQNETISGTRPTGA